MRDRRSERPRGGPHRIVWRKPLQPTRERRRLSHVDRLIADAGDESKTPFHGYRFKIIAPREPNGFALVAWPATYDVTGVMTFVVNQDGIVREKDLGPDTNRAASAMTSYDPDKTWTVVQ